jgi:peroxiredoxin
MKSLKLLLLVGIGSFASFGEAGATERDKTETVIGRRVPDIVLPDATGKQIALSDFNEAKTLVVVFLGTQCPIGNSYVPLLGDLQQRFQDQSVQVIGINSNLSDTAESIAQHVADFKVSFPVLVDKDQVAADLFGARRTPEAFVLDRRRHIRYRGRIDDRFGYTFKRDEARQEDLENALKEMLAGKRVTIAEVEPEGCLITRRDRNEGQSEITFTKQVSRIVNERCAECHHPGTAAPFSLLSYDDVKNWSEMIKETVTQRRMPPWDADPRYGKFKNDLRMTNEEIETLVSWIDNGAPEGDAKDLPEPRVFAEGWTIDKPDIVFAMPEEFTIKATGTVEYQYFVTPTNFKEDVWVQASEARPGNRKVVHHIIAFIRENGTTAKGISGLPAVGGFAPGEEPQHYPPGVGFKIPAGADIVWQVHYTPTGKVEKDRSEVGLVLCKEPPQRAAKGGGAFNFAFSIPPGAESHQVVSSKKFSQDVELMSLMPHMHVRGKDFRYTAQYSDGRTEILLNVPNYDFNWQHRYLFAEPLHIPKGTTIECVAHFDNSADNPANPDPTKEVRWGDQTWEEMMIGWYSHVDANKSE